MCLKEGDDAQGLWKWHMGAERWHTGTMEVLHEGMEK